MQPAARALYPEPAPGDARAAARHTLRELEPPAPAAQQPRRGARAAAPLALRQAPSEALRLAARFARALERYLANNGGAAPRTQLVGVVRAWVPRWDADVPPLLADALIEGLARQGKVVATRHHVGLADAVATWRRRFARYPQRLTQPVDQVARECDVPVSAVHALRALARAVP